MRGTRAKNGVQISAAHPLPMAEINDCSWMRGGGEKVATILGRSCSGTSSMPRSRSGQRKPPCLLLVPANLGEKPAGRRGCRMQPASPYLLLVHPMRLPISMVAEESLPARAACLPAPSPAPPHTAPASRHPHARPSPPCSGHRRLLATGAATGSRRAHAGPPPQAVPALAAAILLHGDPLDARALRRLAHPRAGQPPLPHDFLVPPVRAPARRPSVRPLAVRPRARLRRRPARRPWKKGIGGGGEWRGLG
jgi:hypothetical protein